ncbi:helix-turn-helix domain-containing protein, partial [Myroides injenensis]|uniref:helix-turn-helix domain-containing protein n=1 Tax=Myroides injenensis TaxID=1183151 RepID=UPI0004745368
MTIYIKNMVCARCKMAVETVFKELGFHPTTIELGEVTIEEDISQEQMHSIEVKLLALGFELLDDKKSKTVTKIKSVLIELVQEKNAKLDTNLSSYLSEHLKQDYNTLSNLFSQLESTTIEQYFILLKIERVKELLVYDEISLKEIAYLLNYSSVAHLSKQFKKVTGLTPTHFKTTGNNRRNLIDKL